MEKTTAALTATGAVFGAQYLGSLRAPTPNHPRTALWYALLRKPGFTPPGPAFGVAWTLLDTLLAYTGYRLLTAPRGAKRSTALALWGADIAGVAGFSWVFFGRKKLGEAAGVSAGLLASTLATIAVAEKVDRPAAFAAIPLAAWVSFATLLQEEVWRRNR